MVNAEPKTLNELRYNCVLLRWESWPLKERTGKTLNCNWSQSSTENGGFDVQVKKTNEDAFFSSSGTSPLMK